MSKKLNKTKLHKHKEIHNYIYHNKTLERQKQRVNLKSNKRKQHI